MHIWDHVKMNQQLLIQSENDHLVLCCGSKAPGQATEQLEGLRSYQLQAHAPRLINQTHTMPASFLSLLAGPVPSLTCCLCEGNPEGLPCLPNLHHHLSPPLHGALEAANGSAQKEEEKSVIFGKRGQNPEISYAPSWILFF